MRIAIDLQACQTESRLRGIGRYSMDLTKALLAARHEHDEYLLGIDKTYPAGAAQVHRQLESCSGFASRFSYSYPGPVYGHGAPGDTLRPAAEALIRQHYSAFSPDVVHVNSLFEGFIEHAGGLGQLAKMPGTVSSVTLYDLIPQIFPHLYLTAEEHTWWYRRKLLDLCQFEVILCISEATKADAMRLLGLPSERLAVIHAGVDEHFFDQPEAGDEIAVKRQFGIRDRFVLYTGNGDLRKNLQGAVESFAAVPRELRRDVQLVLNQVGDERAIRQVAARAGLAASDLIVTGRISDAALKQLFRACDVFFFPSLYEGFGLPVLEAMACGAPTIAGDNSSLPEVIGRSDALFNAASTADAAQCLSRALSDADFRSSLRETGLQRAREFTWQRTAELSRQAWQEAIERRKAGKQVSVEKRLKIALVTPMRPEQTGIADYVAELLPALSIRMDVDVYTSADLSAVKDAASVGRVRSWQELRANAAQYDQVVYQFGNSPFHAHMFGLLGEVPGMVVLHDFFLSSMLANMDEVGMAPGVFAAELEFSHGCGAVDVLDRHGAMAARQVYPASRRVIEQADAVAVHSAHAIDMARSFFPAIPRGPLMRVPMPQETRAPVSAEDRSRIRASLGISEHELLIVSFGFIADTKLNLEILEALADPRLRERRELRFVFVGGMPGDDYGQAVTKAIKDHPMRERIEVAGFVSQEKYEQYLRAADVAIQLRQLSRGETSKSVLDCMSHGLAVIVNDYGSFAELPDHAVAKIAAVVEPVQVADRLDAWLRAPADRLAQAEAGRDYVSKMHSPFVVAEQYERAVALSIRARKERTGKELASRLIDAFSRSAKPSPSELASVENTLSQMSSEARTRLLVDVGEMVRIDHGTGVQRVVRNLVREFALTEGASRRCVPVALDADDRLKPAPEFLSEKLGVRTTIALESRPVDIGDNLFLLDASWENPERFSASIEDVRANGGRVYAMVYDLIPLRFPQHCVEFMPRVFERWLSFVVANCDGLICISRAVADDLHAWIGEKKAPHRSGLRIGHIQLGCDVDEKTAVESDGPSERVRAAMGDCGDAVLMVGTVEPRKRHDLALDAFERLWREGDPRRLVVIGKKGWNVESLCERILAHPEHGKRLHWLQGISDADLNFAYRNAGRILQASDAEGFGLPLIEAARYDRPLLLSDIAVFREIAGDHADYFAAGDATALAGQLKAAATATRGKLVWATSWRDSALQATQLMSSGPWDYELP